jgi:lipoprotein-releasing system ATP-binding protein
VSISFANVSFSYPKSERAALQEVTLDIPAGSKTAVMGLSGSGKSTALALASLLLHPRSGGRSVFGGEIAYHGPPNGRAKYSELMDEACNQMRLQEFGIVLQRPYLLPHFTCLDNIAMSLLLAGRPLDVARRVAESLLAAAGIEHLARSMPSKISGGERQRVAVLRALVHNPRVLFADEPVSSLDFVNADLVLNLLARWHQGTLNEPSASPGPRTLILVTHGVHKAWEMTENFVVLHAGKVVGGKVHSKSSLAGPQALSNMIERGLHAG